MLSIISFTVPSIGSSTAADTVRQAVAPTAGVENVVVNVPARLVQVHYDPARTNSEALKAALEAAGFLVQRYSDGHR